MISRFQVLFFAYNAVNGGHLFSDHHFTDAKAYSLNNKLFLFRIASLNMEGIKNGSAFIHKRQYQIACTAIVGEALILLGGSGRGFGVGMPVPERG